MKFFKPFPAAGTVFYGSLFCLITGLGGRFTHALPMPSSSTTPSIGFLPTTVAPQTTTKVLATTAEEAMTEASTAAPTASTFSSCEALKMSEEMKLSEDVRLFESENIQRMFDVCEEHFDESIYTNGIVKISSQEDLSRLGTESALYIIQSVTNTDQNLNLGLEDNFNMPCNSGLVGNLWAEKRPNLTSDTGNVQYTISATNSMCDYLFANIEVDSKSVPVSARDTFQAVMNLRGARKVRLVNAVMARKPLPRFVNDPPGSITHEALEIGCTDGQLTPKYEIIDSEIDMEGCSFNSHRSPGVAVLGCGGGVKIATLLLKETDFKLDVNSNLCSEENPHVAFDFSNLESHSLNFESGSLGNRVITTRGENRPDLFARFHDLKDGSNRVIESHLFKGVFGLADGRGWGIRQQPDSDRFEAVLESLNYWATNQCVDPGCNCQVAPSDMGDGSGFMNSSMIPDEMTIANCTVIPSGYEMTITTTELDTTHLPTSLYQTSTSAIAPTSTMMASVTTMGTAMPSMSMGIDSQDMLTTSVTSSVAPTTMMEVMPTPTPSPTSPPTPPGPGVQNFNNCAAISTGEDTTLDKAVCEEAYALMSFSGITKIPYYVNSLDGVITEGTGDGRLYIFDGDSPSSTYLTDEGLVEYDLPVGFTIPDNSGFAGNRKGGKYPEITIADGQRSDHIITVNGHRANYLFLHIEIDSREADPSSTTKGILNLNGAESAQLVDVKLVRRPDLLHTQGYTSLTLGCSGQAPTPTAGPTPSPVLSVPRYTIRDSIIDISEGRAPTGNGYAGSAFIVSDCDSSAADRVQLTVNNTRVIIEEGFGLAGSSGTTFWLFGQQNLSLEFVNSTCNEIVSPAPNSEDISTRSSYSGAMPPHNYIGALPGVFGGANSSNQKLFTGVFGLKNGMGWGYRADAQSPFKTDVLDWNYWQVNQALDVACVMPTPSVPVMTATASPGDSSDGSGGDTATTSISMTDFAPSPTPVPVIRMCEEMFEEGSEDRRACEDYIEYPEFEFSQVVKIPHGMRNLTSVVTSDKTNTLFILDSVDPDSGSGSGAATSSEDQPAPTPDSTPETCTACPSNTGTEYDLPADFIMPAGSGFVGNRIDGKRPEITIADGEASDYIIRVSKRNPQGVYSHLDGKYLFAHVEIDSKGVNPASSDDGILYLNGSRLAVLIDVALVRRDKLELHSGYNALVAGCASTGMEQPRVVVQSSVVDISASGAFQGFTGSAFFVENHSGDTSSCRLTNQTVGMQLSGTTVIIKPGDSFHSSTGSAFYFFNEDYHSIDFLPGSTCNRVVSNGMITEDLSGLENHRYLGILPDFFGGGGLSTSDNKLFTGALGLSNGEGWGQLPYSNPQNPAAMYEADLRPWCFWEQQTPSVNVACVTSSVIAESCTPPMESTTVASLPSSTPEVTMTETSTMLTSSEPGPEATSSVIPTPTLASTPVPTSTQGTDSTATTTLSGPVETPAVTSTASTASTMTGGTSLPVTTEPSTAVPQSSTTETPSTTQGIEETTTAADRATTSAFPTVTLSSGVTGMPQGSTTMSSPTPEPQKGEGVELSAGQGVGIGIGTIVTAALIIDQAVTQSVYRLANSEKVKMVANVLGAALPYVFQVGIPNLISHTYHSVFGRKTFTDDPSINLNPMGGADSVDTVSTTADVK